ncbi:MAG: hypothetical protein HKN39_07310 [Flavobacteriales bacterium]|nr:hypothetical protein [Flavobacteriales bacterium]
MRWFLIILFFTPIVSMGQTDFKNLKKAVGLENLVLELKLSGKKHSKLPEELRAFKNLKVLSIKRSNLDSLPSWLSELPIEELYLSKNRFQKMPAVLFEMKGLRELDLGHNYISNVPAEISQLQDLEKLSLWGNGIYELPLEIKEMPNLKTIDLRVIDLNRQDQIYLRETFPKINIEMSPPCNCM